MDFKKVNNELICQFTSQFTSSLSSLGTLPLQLHWSFQATPSPMVAGTSLRCSWPGSTILHGAPQWWTCHRWSSSQDADKTTEYLDELSRLYPDNITVYWKLGRCFWDGKREMVKCTTGKYQWGMLAMGRWMRWIVTVEQIFTARKCSSTILIKQWLSTGAGILLEKTCY